MISRATKGKVTNVGRKHHAGHSEDDPDIVVIQPRAKIALQPKEEYEGEARRQRGRPRRGKSMRVMSMDLPRKSKFSDGPGRGEAEHNDSGERCQSRRSRRVRRMAGVGNRGSLNARAKSSWGLWQESFREDTDQREQAGRQQGEGEGDGNERPFDEGGFFGAAAGGGLALGVVGFWGGHVRGKCGMRRTFFDAEAQRRRGAERERELKE